MFNWEVLVWKIGDYLYVVVYNCKWWGLVLKVEVGD